MVTNANQQNKFVSLDGSLKCERQLISQNPSLSIKQMQNIKVPNTNINYSFLDAWKCHKSKLLYILVAWFASFLYMNLPGNLWIKTVTVARSVFFDSRWQYYTGHSTSEWWHASFEISDSAWLIASCFFLFFLYWRFSLNLTFRKHSNCHILGFTWACVSHALVFPLQEKGRKVS